MLRKRKRRRNPFLRPVPGDNPDKAVFRLLERFDQHIGDRRRVDFYLYFSSKRKAERAIPELQCLGLTAEMIESERQWLCLATKMVTLNLNTLAGMRLVLEDIALRCGGRYDGWETTIHE
jgi:hypothetical protein